VVDKSKTVRENFDHSTLRIGLRFNCNEARPEILVCGHRCLCWVVACCPTMDNSSHALMRLWK